MVRGDRATSRSQAPWALEMGVGSHLQDAGRPSGRPLKRLRWEMTVAWTKVVQEEMVRSGQDWES